MVRVLWFTDVQPREVERHLGASHNPGRQAWVDRLASELGSRDDVALEVASPGAVAYEAFCAGGVRYRHLSSPPARSRLQRMCDGWSHRLTAPETLAAADDLIRETAPDVVHVHGTESAFGSVATASAVAPCVISLQGILWQYQRVYFAGRTAGDMARCLANSEFAKGRGVVHGYLRMRAMAWREEQIMRRGRWFVGRTGWDRASLAAVNPVAVYLHCDEIMRKEFYSADWSSRSHHGATIYSTSSAMLFKGGETLLEALAILRRGGTQDVRLRIAGVPPGSEVDGIYRRTAHRHRVDGIVEWLGRLDAPAIVDEIQAADAFAYPTHIDNSPNALVEAMLAGAPIVATYAGGIPSLLRDGDEGLLVPRGDPSALAAAIRRLLDERTEAARLGAAARARALIRNDPARIAGRMVEIYREIITGATADRPWPSVDC